MSHFWNKIDSPDQVNARARLDSFLLLINAQVPHSCARLTDHIITATVHGKLTGAQPAKSKTFDFIKIDQSGRSICSSTWSMHMETEATEWHCDIKPRLRKDHCAESIGSSSGARRRRRRRPEPSSCPCQYIVGASALAAPLRASMVRTARLIDPLSRNRLQNGVWIGSTCAIAHCSFLGFWYVGRAGSGKQSTTVKRRTWLLLRHNIMSAL